MTTPNFISGSWRTEIDVRNFIQCNYTEYNGDHSFLAPATKRTKLLWRYVLELIKEEKARGGVLDLDVTTPSTITSHNAGYLEKSSEIIVGLQTDAPLKRAIKPNGGIRLVEEAAKSFGYTIPPEIYKIFSEYKKTHNDGVFSVYTETHRNLRRKHIILGLPDNYARGRIIGDYRRVALYGIDRLIEDKKQSLERMSSEMTESNIRLREEIFEQIKALKSLGAMALKYGIDISKPATDTKEAIQWLYFGYLGAVKEQDGAAMSMGRIDAFLDVFAEADLKSGRYTEAEIQEMVDDFVIKLRIVRHLRPPQYDEIFAGDPTWVTLVLGGMSATGKHLVTKMSYRFLHTLYNLGPSPEPNLTILWADKLPENWKRYCAKVSIETSSVQYENDELMLPYHGDDYGIACCVSAMRIGKEMQFFGARANLPKILLLAINGGKEEPLYHNKTAEGAENYIKTERNTKADLDGGDVIIEGLKPLNSKEFLDYDEVWKQTLLVMDYIADQYVQMMNVIHYMHDKYYYENLEMALHDRDVTRFMAFGIAGLSCVADSLSAIKYAKVKPIWNRQGVAERYEVIGDFPKFGNDDDRVDDIAKALTENFIIALRKRKTYRDSIPTLSILTITSNVMYGKGTGETPDGRKSGEPFAPGANPMHGRDQKGAIASLNSVAKLSYDYCRDGISNTFSIVPDALGKTENERVVNLVQLLQGYFVGKKAHHLNVNVFNRETLLDAQAHPEKYPQLTIRVSGYAVRFSSLSKEQQDEVINRTFHKTLTN